jgi:hypothetical protein
MREREREEPSAEFCLGNFFESDYMKDADVRMLLK